MNRLTRCTAAAAIAAAVTMAGLAATAASASAAVATCEDVRTGVAYPATVVGTAGPDVIRVRTGDVVAALGGNDVIYTDYATSAIICGDEGNDVVGSAGTSFGTFSIRGGDGSDRLTGGTGNDQIFGGPGNDLLDGRNGTDLLNGAADADQCVNGEILVNCEY